MRTDYRLPVSEPAENNSSLQNPDSHSDQYEYASYYIEDETDQTKQVEVTIQNQTNLLVKIEGHILSP